MTEHATTFNTKPSSSELALTLNQIRGIHASCVVLTPKQDISEIHLVASTERKPKQIVRDIETILFVKHGVKVDYRCVSMVQIPDEQLLKIPIARAEIQKVTEEVTGDQKRVRVEIKGASRVAIGEAYEKIENPMPFRTSAKATIAAIEKLLNRSLDIQVEDAQTFRLGSHEIFLVIVRFLTEHGEETFVGASFVGMREIETAARATLDALNRRIYNLSLQSPREADVPEQSN